jgi:hypothetical protein
VYVNGDILSGNFTQGLPHGMLLYTFIRTGKSVHASYIRGRREGWSDEVAIVAKGMIAWLHDAAEFRREFKEE